MLGELEQIFRDNTSDIFTYSSNNYIELKKGFNRREQATVVLVINVNN